MPAPLLSYHRGKWRLRQDYVVKVAGHRITIPNGFIFDLASIPRGFWWACAPFELSIVAPLVHDFLYRYQGDPPIGSLFPMRVLTRRMTDDLFRLLMELEGVPKWRRGFAYRAVRAFGRSAWNRHRPRPR
jgi:hypothetical protein